MQMPFGKFRGVPLQNVPEQYLAWLAATIELREPLASAVRQEQARRRSPIGDMMITVPRELVPVLKEVIDRGVRACARLYHPDLVGGDGSQMRSLNAAAETLRRQLA